MVPRAACVGGLYPPYQGCAARATLADRGHNPSGLSCRGRKTHRLPRFVLTSWHLCPYVRCRQNGSRVTIHIFATAPPAPPQSGSIVHHQDHAMTPASFRPARTAARITKGKPPNATTVRIIPTHHTTPTASRYQTVDILRAPDVGRAANSEMVSHTAGYGSNKPSISLNSASCRTRSASSRLRSASRSRRSFSKSWTTKPAPFFTCSTAALASSVITCKTA